MRGWTGVLAHNVPHVWPEIEHWVTKACKRGGDKYWPEDVLNALLRRDFQLWVTRKDGRVDGAVITEIITYPRKTIASMVFAMGSEPHDCAEIIALVTSWAAANGCDGSKSEMRPGFEKPFREAGWKKTHIVMETVH